MPRSVFLDALHGIADQSQTVLCGVGNRKSVDHGKNLIPLCTGVDLAVIVTVNTSAILDSLFVGHVCIDGYTVVLQRLVLGIVADLQGKFFASLMDRSY